MIIRSYAKLSTIDNFEDRYEYLALKGSVGHATFGFDRYLNQRFYASSEWKRARNDVIARDNGCDLGIDGMEIYNKLLVHHMNPMESLGATLLEEYLLDPNNLITTTHRTHNAIHYGNESHLVKALVERSEDDTKLW